MTRRTLQIIFVAVAAAAGSDRALAQPELGDGVPPDWVRHGDILVPADMPLAGFSVSPWPDGIIYFEFEPGTAPADMQAMREAMDDWNYSGADVTFVRRTPGVDDNYVHVRDASGNSSAVGMVGGQQFVNIFNWDYEFVMVHELCHAMGFWHEQSRPDRDTFVTIQWDAICQDCCGGGTCSYNFDITSNWIVLATPYDFDSVMHYTQCAFSDCGGGCPADPDCRTIVVLPPNQSWQDSIGQLTHLSANDVQDMMDAYGVRSLPLHYIDQEWGSPGGDGTLEFPYGDFTTAEAGASPGAEIYVRGGVYDEPDGLVLDTPAVYRASVSSVVVR